MWTGKSAAAVVVGALIAIDPINIGWTAVNIAEVFPAPLAAATMFCISRTVLAVGTVHSVLGPTQE